jgi:imidazolonepropionase
MAGDTLLIENISQLVTCEPDLFDSADEGGEALGIVDDASLLIREGRIERVGRRGSFGPPGGARSLDAGGSAVLPGLVDCHTHTVYAGTRQMEYEMRVRGAAYMEIAAAGGGINSTVRDVRAASEDRLVELGRRRLLGMLSRGATTVEVKSGYGLTTGDELKMLRAIGRLRRESPVAVVPTFLGAHEVPPEFKGRRGEYVELVVDEMLPEVAREGLAEFCDVFCERGVFTAEEAGRVLRRGKELGLKPMIHADEFADSGAALVAAEVGAISAGHLGHASARGLAGMKRAGTVAVLLPGVSLGLGRTEFADARRILDMGLDVALATDFNPGSSLVDSLPIITGLACSFMKMTPAEAILGVTLKAARALDRDRLIGSIKPGKTADLAFFDIPDFRYIPYHFGGEMVSRVVKGGVSVFERTEPRALTLPPDGEG